MTATSYCRGHAIEYTKSGWVYSDTKDKCDDSRPCARCGKYPTIEGYDACLGYIDGVSSACCGHGVEDGYRIELGPDQMHRSLT